MNHSQNRRTAMDGVSAVYPRGTQMGMVVNRETLGEHFVVAPMEGARDSRMATDRPLRGFGYRGRVDYVNACVVIDLLSMGPKYGSVLRVNAPLDGIAGGVPMVRSVVLDGAQGAAVVFAENAWDVVGEANSHRPTVGVGESLPRFKPGDLTGAQVFYHNRMDVHRGAEACRVLATVGQGHTVNGRFLPGVFDRVS
jgi:hypothetical protein